MYQILKKQTLNANTKLMVIEAPHVARKAEPVSSSSCVSAQKASVFRSRSQILTAKRFRHDYFSGGRRNDDGARRAE